MCVYMCVSVCECTRGCNYLSTSTPTPTPTLPSGAMCVRAYSMKSLRNSWSTLPARRRWAAAGGGCDERGDVRCDVM